MTSKIIDGRKVAADLLLKTQAFVAELNTTYTVIPGLAIIKVGDNPASTAYVNIKQKRAAEVGIHTELVTFSSNISEQDVLRTIDMLNARKDIHGIIIQLPLPAHLNADTLIDHVSPQKDVDGFHPDNVGAIATGRAGILPCTPKGILYLLKTLPIHLNGKHAVVIGRSRIVGKPMAALLLKSNCTITHIHSHSQNWRPITQLADIIVTATGTPRLLTPEHIKTGAIIIDVGSSKISLPNGQSKFVGDVREDVVQKAGFITPVPGGVGPMTVAMLLQNTAEAARSQINV